MESHRLSWEGRQVIDRDGDKVGKIDAIYLDQETDQPEWAAVHTGLFGMNTTFIPLADAQPDGEDVRVPYEKDHIKDAPNVRPDGRLSPEEEATLYQHYGLRYSEPRGGTFQDDTFDEDRGTVGRDVSGPETDDAMTRSEEELRVAKDQQPRERVRLKKFVTTEMEQRTVPVQREEVRVEREPITDANVDRATDGPAISDEEHEVVLNEEQARVEKVAVPKERVRLDKDTVTEDREISEEVRKEQIELERNR